MLAIGEARGNSEARGASPIIQKQSSVTKVIKVVFATGGAFIGAAVGALGGCLMTSSSEAVPRLLGCAITHPEAIAQNCTKNTVEQVSQSIPTILTATVWGATIGALGGLKLARRLCD